MKYVIIYIRSTSEKEERDCTLGKRVTRKIGPQACFAKAHVAITH
jgi:hypothetical protein